MAGACAWVLRKKLGWHQDQGGQGGVGVGSLK